VIFSFEQITKPGGPKVVKVAFNNGWLKLGDGTKDYVVVSAGSGTFSSPRQDWPAR